MRKKIHRYPLLDAIHSPADLKTMSRKEMVGLCADIRECLIDVVSTTGGHLAPNLGVVELTVALHHVFDSPTDKMIWDVSHQSYVHKLLTGRRDRIHTLRQSAGLSGFQKRTESEHDAFGAGHAGTSISAAVGMAVARDMNGADNHVVAVIGDGSMTAGMAFEALNHAGGMKRNLLVVLNDNEMSISPNVGALSAYLSRTLSGDLYSWVREETEQILSHIPRVGRRMAQMARKAEEAVKGFITPGVVFEELGFRYLGPIDGHNLDHLIPVLQNIHRLKGPTLLHVVTKKGKGYPLAEDNPVSYHGTPKFDKTVGVLGGGSSLPAYTKVFGDALIELANIDPRVVAITAAMPTGTGTHTFAEKFPERFFDVGIAEQHAITFAAGLAAEGKRPVTAIYSTFMQRGYDQLIHDVALQHLPVVFAMDRAGLVGDDGPTHHGTFDLSFLRAVPGLVIMAPRNGQMLRDMLFTGLELDAPCALRYPRGSIPCAEPLQGFSLIPVGSAETLQAGSDMAILAVGSMVTPALEAARLLAQEGFSVRVVDPRFIKPLDEEAMLAAADTGTVLTVEENALAGGFGSAVLECFERHGVTPRVRRMGIPDRFIEQGPQDHLRAELGLCTEGIADTARLLLAGRTRHKVLRAAAGRTS
ncbi:MAG: 1-deoxy-D-xylulose-5-phosphate synthase [Nitrospirota bacterium]|nr:1-deoxy-D-xylulose-5-phosphate synthase [Nitrospirota bacterium]